MNDVAVTQSIRTHGDIIHIQNKHMMKALSSKGFKLLMAYNRIQKLLLAQDSNKSQYKDYIC